MAEYIDLEAAKDELLSWAVCINHPEHLMREDSIHVLDAIPTDDVAPVRHGWWIYHPDDLFPAESTQKCSCCHEEEYLTLCNENYCPSCGAVMDLEE